MFVAYFRQGRWVGVGVEGSGIKGKLQHTLCLFSDLFDPCRGLAAGTCYTSTGETEARGSQILGHPGLHGKTLVKRGEGKEETLPFGRQRPPGHQAALGYKTGPCFK